MLKKKIRKPIVKVDKEELKKLGPVIKTKEIK